MSNAQWEVVTTVLWCLANLVWAVAYFWRTWLWSVQKEQIFKLQEEYSELEAERNRVCRESDSLDKSFWLAVSERDKLKAELEGLHEAYDHVGENLEDAIKSRDDAREGLKTQERLYAELKEKYNLLEAVRMAAVTALTTKPIEVRSDE